MDKEEFSIIHGTKFQSMIDKLSDEQQDLILIFIKKITPELKFQETDTHIIFNSESFDVAKLTMIYKYIKQFIKD